MLISLVSLLTIILVASETIEKTITDVKMLLYGVAAGVAVFLLIIYGIKIKLSASSEERENAKKAIIYVIVGLIVMMIGANLVEILYRIPEEPPRARIVNAWLQKVSNPLIPGDWQSGLRFSLYNTASQDISGIEVEVTTLKHQWCEDDLFKHTFPKMGLLINGETIPYSYDNFCENASQFSIVVASDQNWWTFCLNCPGEGSGNCQVSDEHC